MPITANIYNIIKSIANTIDIDDNELISELITTFILSLCDITLSILNILMVLTILTNPN